MNLMLETKNISYFYEAAKALDAVSIKAKEKKITAVLGSNGAGKTTFINIVAGVLKPSEGKVYFNGKDITDYPAHRRVEEGISLIPQENRIFPNLNVLENLKAGAYSNRVRKKVNSNLERAYRLFPILEERKRQIASTLSGGEQKMLAIARGLMSEPSLLLMDEPLTGLQPSLVSLVIGRLKEICHEEGITILLVEQNLYQTLNIMDWGYVLENGRVVLEGSAEDLKDNIHVKKAYLGL